MKKLLDAVEKDKLAGIYKRSDGKYSFIQRKVEFETIDFQPEYIFSNQWGIFKEPLESINWNLPYEELDRNLKIFAKECSERFHYLWYRYIDVMLARALSLNDKNIFIKKFINKSLFLDLGIPEQKEWSNVPEEVHQKCINEYNKSLNFTTRYNIYYLTQYLENLTDDIIEYLRPFRELWELEEQKKKIYEHIKSVVQSFSRKPFFDFIKKNLDEILLNLIKTNLSKIQNLIIEKLILKSNINAVLSYFERKIILENLIKNKEFKNFDFFIILNEYTNFPSFIEESIRKILFYENLMFHELLLKLKKIYNYTSRSSKNNIIILDILQKSKDEYSEKFTIYYEKKINILYEIIEVFHYPHIVYLESLIDLYNQSQFKTLYDFPVLIQKILNSSTHREVKGELKEILLSSLKEIHSINQKIIKYYENSFFLHRKLFIPDEKYKNIINETPEYIPGNPFQEKEILDYFRELIKKRLRPIRNASNEYSLLAYEKHGIFTLNPVMKLWKKRINISKNLPEITLLEFNTALTIECLLELAQLVDGELIRREVLRGKIVKEKKQKENLENMFFMLIPGSCYPLKEIPSSHFPEYKNKIIGEKRNLSEVGIEETHYILTGGWYNKKNHTLYYPVGGDNAELLKKIYLGIKTNIVPAFFFALGQFVFECLPDTILYYKTTETTFREILLKIYKQKYNNDEDILKKKILFAREEVKFQFSIYYSLMIMQNLTGGLHIQNKIFELYKWFFHHLKIQNIFDLNKERRKEMRIKAQKIIEDYNYRWCNIKIS